MVRSWQEVVIVSDELPEEVQRWTAKRRPALIVSIIRGATSVQEAARKYGLTVAEVEDWREKFLLAAVIDCHDREIVGYEFSLRGRAKEAERALEEACIARFGTLRPEGDTPVLRSDNGLIFQSRRFRAALRDYSLRQEFITPYTPDQNGMIERFFRSLKEECVWQHLFQDFAEARQTIRDWIRRYNEERPHQSLSYLSPAEFRAQQLQLVASNRRGALQSDRISGPRRLATRVPSSPHRMVSTSRGAPAPKLSPSLEI